MPRPKSVVPAYLLHKPSGQAYVRLPQPDGRRKAVYLGRHGSAESRAEYARLVAALPPPGTVPVAPMVKPSAGPLSCAELILAFLRHAQLHYHKPAGGGTFEYDHFRYSLKPVRELFGQTPAAEFGPLALKAVRQRMVEAGLSRPVVNARVNRVRRAWKWAAGEELVPFEAYHRLTSVVALGKGRCPAPEPEPVGPVDPEVVAATLARVGPTLRAMILFHRHTGCRPQDVTGLTPAMVDRTSPVWTYRPRQHKGAWRGKERVVRVGPQAQAALRPYLGGDPDKPAFSPRRAVQELRERQRAARTSKVQPSQADRSKPDPKVAPRDGYCPRSYCRAVARAAERAGVPPWHPNQLRHLHGTLVRQRFGLEAAGASLGHDKLSATEIYAEKDAALAERVAAELG